MQKLQGRLLYMGWLNLPWKLVTDDGEVDLWPSVERFFASLNGKRVHHEQTRGGYTLLADEFSEFQLNYVQGKYVLLEKLEGFGIFNVTAYLDTALVWLSGQLVDVEIEDGKWMKFTADESEEVLGIYFGDDNLCEVPKGAEDSVCKAWQDDCCIFLSMGANGYNCEKFSGPTASMLLGRLARGNIHTKRIGNCALRGRKRSNAAAV